MKTRLVVYGVDEYQGALVSRCAAGRGIAHVGAGRDIARVAAHANALASGDTRIVEPRVFGLGHEGRIAAQLDDAAVIVNCATPQGETARPLVDAALATGTHYVDLCSTGPLVAALMARDAEAMVAGVSLVAGAAFDFAAADAMAARLATSLPTARALTLAVKRGGLSHAEARELVAAVRRRGDIVKNGQFVETEPGERTFDVDFGAGPEAAAVAPWRGEIVGWRRRGPYSTIESYEVLPPPLARAMKRGGFAHFLFRRGWGLRALERRLARDREGPGEAELARGRAVVWGEALTPDGKVRRARLETPAPALYTAEVVLCVARKLAEGGVAAGFRLPSELGSGGLAEEIEGVTWREIADAAETLMPDPVALAAAR